MPKRGKQYKEMAKLVDRATLYEVEDAMQLITQTAKAKFDETVEAHFKLGVDGRHADQQVRGAIVLPHGTGKTKKVLVFAKGPKAAEAEAAGLFCKASRGRPGVGILCLFGGCGRYDAQGQRPDVQLYQYAGPR